MHRGALLSLLALLCLACAGPANTVDERDPASEPPATEEAVPPTDERASSRPLLFVVDADGAPVPDAAAVIVTQGYTLDVGTAAEPLRPDARGAIELERRIDDERIVLAWAPGHAAARLELPSMAGEHRVVLGAPTPLVGRVIGGSVEHVWLQSSDPEAPWPYFVRCDVDPSGRFRVDGLAAATYSVSSVPIGGAPVLAADVEGRARFLAEDPGPQAEVGHRFLDREIAADGVEHALRVSVGEAVVRGRVVDEADAPIADAEVRLLTESGREVRTRTDRRGGFVTAMRPAPYVHVTAHHPSFGAQWTDYDWEGWRYGGPIPDAPIELVLRRGVELAGRIERADGSAYAREPVVLVPAYRGSGPPSEEVRTDAEGRFRFERMVLASFELVPGSLRNWSPDGPGSFERVASADPEAWVRAATDCRPLALRLEAYERVPVTVELGPDARRVEVWMRWGRDLYWGSLPSIERGRVRLVMERGRSHELWITEVPEGQPMLAPWGRGEPPDWSGTPDGPLALRITPGRADDAR